MTQFGTRVATHADIPDMHRIRLSVIENRLSDPGSINLDSYRPFVDASAAWVFDHGGKIVGFAAMDQQEANVWALFVDPDAEGKGVGKALHEELLGWGRQCGLDEIWLTTTPGTRAEQFYRAMGWSAAGFAANGEVRFTRAI